MGKDIGKNITKILTSRYSQNPLNHAKQSAADALETASRKRNSKSSTRNW